MKCISNKQVKVCIVYNGTGHNIVVVKKLCPRNVRLVLIFKAKV